MVPIRAFPGFFSKWPEILTPFRDEESLPVPKEPKTDYIKLSLLGPDLCNEAYACHTADRKGLFHLLMTVANIVGTQTLK